MTAVQLITNKVLKLILRNNLLSNLTLILGVKHGLNDSLHRFSHHDVSGSRGSRLITSIFAKWKIFINHYLNKGYRCLCFLWLFLPIGDVESPLSVTRRRSKWLTWSCEHYSDVIMSVIATQITSFAIAYSTVYSGANQRKHQSSAWLTFVRCIHRWPVSSTQRASNAENVCIWWRHHEYSGTLNVDMCNPGNGYKLQLLSNYSAIVQLMSSHEVIKKPNYTST